MSFLIGYIDKFNEQFTVIPKDPQGAFRELEDGVDLSTVLCIKEQRVVSDGSGFSYGGKYYQVMGKEKPVGLPRGVTITVLNSHKRELKVMYNGVVGIRNQLHGSKTQGKGFTGAMQGDTKDCSTAR